MENRFGFKEAVLLAAVVVVGVMVLASMRQNDRNWDKFREMQGTLKVLGEDVRALQEGLANGVVAAGGGGHGSPREDLAQAFPRTVHLPEASDYAEGDWFIGVFGARVKNLTPHISGDTYAATIENYVVESLMVRDPNTFEWIPRIATDWSVSEDGLAYTFNMRRDVTFSDGSPMTARDVVFTFNWVMNPKVNSPRSKAFYEKIESVIAEDDYRVVFKFKEPYFQAMSFSAGMGILSEKYYSQFTPEEYNVMPGLLFGSGAYQLNVDPTQWAPSGEGVALVRNENYWGPKPAITRIRFREITGPTARLAEFRNRSLDQFSVSPEMYRDLTRDEDLRKQAELHEYESVNSGYSYIGWNGHKNGEPTPFADARVRRAMSMLIDRKAICARILENLASPAVGPFHPLGTQVDPEIEAFPYDPEEARRLLAEVGYEDRDGDQRLEGPDGRPLGFKFIYGASNPDSRRIGQFIKDAMGAQGIWVELDPLDWPLMQAKLEDRSFDAIMLGWGGGIESDPYQMFHSKTIEGGGDNFISYRNPELDALIDQARGTVDDQARRALWHQIHQILWEDQPYTFMYNRKSVVYVDRRFENVEVTNLGLNGVEEYYVPSAAQLRSTH